MTIVELKQWERRFAQLIAQRGAPPVPGRPYVIRYQPSQYAFAAQIAEAAMTFPEDLRPSRVVASQDIPAFGALNLRQMSLSELSVFPEDVALRFNQMADKGGGAYVALQGSDAPHLYASIDPARFAAYTKAAAEALKPFSEARDRSLIHWCVPAMPTLTEAIKVYPELSPKQALHSLKALIYRILSLHRGDFLQCFDRADSLLRQRAEVLNELQIEMLHFTSEDGATDLKIYLRPEARFGGGSKPSEIVEGMRFFSNLPSCENFTTPNCYRTEGKVRITSPFLYQGTVIDGVTLTFKRGLLVNFSVRKGRKAFEALVARKGTRRLGEIGLVDILAPVAQTNRIFYNGILDENRGCHIALGNGYPLRLLGGGAMSPRELWHYGCNQSDAHVDINIGNAQTRLVARCFDGTVVELMVRGRYVGPLAA